MGTLQLIESELEALELREVDNLLETQGHALDTDGLARIGHKLAEIGEADRAHRVIERISPELIEANPNLKQLKHKIDDAIEALELGERVYDPTIPMPDRWKRPPHLPETNDKGSKLYAWYPCRISDVRPGEFSYFFAVPDSERKIYLQTVLEREYNGDIAQFTVDTYYFLCLFEDKSGIMVSQQINSPNTT